MIRRSTPKSIVVVLIVTALTVFVVGPSAATAEPLRADGYDIPSTGEMAIVGAMAAVIVAGIVYAIATSSGDSKKGDGEDETPDVDSTVTSSATSRGLPCLPAERETPRSSHFAGCKQPFSVNVSLATEEVGSRAWRHFDRVPDRSLVRVGLVFTL